MDTLRLVIAEDQAISRDGLVTILAAIEGVDVVGVASDGAEAVAVAQREAADVVLMDLRMPVMDGIEATRRLTESGQGPAVVVLTTYTDDASVLEALRAGACGYLTKDATADDIARALHAAGSGQAIVEASVHARIVERALANEDPGPDPELPDDLSRREGEVLGLIGEGLSNAEIAERLFISRTTVKTHINQILRKTGCRDRPALIVYAFRHELATAPEA